MLEFSKEFYMITKEDIIQAAYRNGFDDVGFTTAEPFDTQRDFLSSHQEEYGWLEAVGLNLMSGTDPRTVLRGAKTVIVLLEVYFRQAYPSSVEGNFGRCYLDDDRVTRDGLTRRLKAFRSYLRDHEIVSKVSYNTPDRVAAARCGMGTFGKNCLFYSRRAARQSSWNLPISVVIDREFAPDEPTLEMGCPDWCRNACITACPTRALKGNGTIDPRKCISYLTYFGEGMTPLELREPMGMYVYGCDRCQNVCPRNAAWLAQELPMNQKVAAKAENFALPRLLHMDKYYFQTKVWPHMFYMSYEDVWRWKMNVARAMGNTHDRKYVPDLIRAFTENEDERTKGMIAWALGNIGGQEAQKALKKFHLESEGLVYEEIEIALQASS